MVIEDLRQQLISHEGLRLKKYKCSRGKWTIGVGWNLDSNKLPSDIAKYLLDHGEITKPMATRMLDIQIKRSLGEAYVLFPKFESYSDVRQHALLDMLFNMGLLRFSGFKKAISAIRSDDWETAAAEVVDSEYYRELGGGSKTGSRPDTIVAMLREG